MPERFEVFWDWSEGGNVQHLAEHGVSPEQCEQVLIRGFSFREPTRSLTGRWIVQNFTDSGIFLVVVFDLEWIDEMNRWLVSRGRPSSRNGRTDVAEMTGRQSGILSPEQRRRMAEAQEWVDANCQSLTREALAWKQERLAIIDVFRKLQAERQRLGVPVEDIARRIAMDAAELIALENDPYPSISLATLMQYAAALGGRIELAFHHAA